MAASLPHLLCPLPSLGLQHRIVMAPLTRLRGEVDTLSAGPKVVEYYAQRASKGGLLVTEGCPISPETPYETAPGIFTKEQEAGWKRVVEAVHRKECKISLQLWHLGRMSHEAFASHPYLKAQNRPLGSVSSSSVTPPGHSRNWKGEKLPYTCPRPLNTDELLTRVPHDYRLAAEAAKRCGFDFVEIHGAHGYLLDQFFCDGVNKRSDEFGPQSAENRTRLLGKVLKEVIDVYGADRVGIRISPTYLDTFAYKGCTDSNPEKTYRDVLTFLDSFHLGYLMLSEPRWNGGRDNADPLTDPTYSIPIRHKWAREVYHGPIIGSSSFTPATAEKAIADGIYDAIAFGRFFISNPDLVERVRIGAPLNKYDVTTFYTKDTVGYTDYPDLEGKIGAGNRKEQIRVEDIGKGRRSKL